VTVAITDVGEVVSSYRETLGALLDTVAMEDIRAAVDALREARDQRRTIFIAGNGGSSATATHLVNDLGKATKQNGTTALRVIGLSDNTAWLTALANDEGYEHVFSGQLENFAEPGDLLILISCSGSSPNLVNAARWAKERGVKTLALLGFDGGLLKDRVDLKIWVESPLGLYGPVESAHAVLADMLTTCLIQDRLGK
jgi:D-sedoheptulose 7-phosphate isomerase